MREGDHDAHQGSLQGTVSGANPMFRNAASKDYAPAEGSPLVRSADHQLADLPTKEYYRDETITMQWRDRASVNDIGAFESTTSSPVRAGRAGP